MDGTPCQVKVPITFTPLCVSSSSGSSDGSSGGSSGGASSGASSQSSESSGSESSGGDGCVEMSATFSFNHLDGEEVPWTNTGSGGGQAAMTRTSDAQTLISQKFNFNLPSGGTVVGLTATYTLSAPGNDVEGVEAGIVALVSSGTAASKGFGNDNYWPTSQQDWALGSDTDTWGQSWGTDEFNSGVSLWLFNVQQSLLRDDVTAYVHEVKLRVCYVL